MDWRRMFFTSKALRELHAAASLPVAHGRVIYWGIRVEDFRGKRESAVSRVGPLRLLFAGRLEQEKGPHTILEALPLLRLSSQKPIEVAISGELRPRDTYHQRLQELGAATNGCYSVKFLGPVPAAAMPGLLRQHDVLVFPSIWPEPFSLVVLEAMAAGLCVVGTTSGGSIEILQEGVNSLTFRADDAEDLARQLQRIVDDASLQKRLADEGQRLVEDQFSLSAQVSQIEAMLQDVLDHRT
jgi:glycosyltransferase involved in cell wall biosynthesis